MAGITDAEFRRLIIDNLLGTDWYVVDPIPQEQINEIALHQILERFSKKYRKEKRLGKRFLFRSLNITRTKAK